MLNGHQAVFHRMVKKAAIDHRYSFLEPAADLDGPVIDRDQFYVRGKFPSTAGRMRYFEDHAPELATAAIEQLGLGGNREHVTHLVITCCTGLSAPGLDLDIIERC